jgi:hypothetical protein
MENTAQEELKAHLIETDEEFRRLSEQHLQYDELLEKLEAKRASTEQDQLEEIRLKKLKLQIKDQMTEILNRVKPAHVG